MKERKGQGKTSIRDEKLLRDGGLKKKRRDQDTSTQNYLRKRTPPTLWGSLFFRPGNEEIW